MRRSRAAVLIAVAVVLLASAAVRLYRLDQPKGYIFDEVYYAKDAKAIIDQRIGPKEGYHWMPGDEISWPHPYFGKLAIALGILLFGNDETGWRFMPALAGLATLLLGYPIARRLGLRREWALLALVLAAVDLLGIAQSRIATLDVFVGVWSVLTIYLALRYVQSGGRLVWLALTGVAGGLALGTKWSGAFACLAALVLILVLWGRRRRRPAATAGRDTVAVTAADEQRIADNQTACEIPEQPDVASTPQPDGSRAARKGQSSKRQTRTAGTRDPLTSRSRVAAVALPLLLLTVLPAVLYVASYGFYFAAGHPLADWWHLHREMWTFSTNLDATHTYASQAPTWILDIRPVWYYFKEHAAHYYGVVAMGHPVIWWAAALTLVTLPVVAILDRRRELVLPSLIVALLYFPWFATSRTSFLYYMAPVAPFLAILVAAGLARLAGQPPTLDSGDESAGLGGQPSATGGGGPAHKLVYGLAAFLGAAAVTALFWWPISQGASFVFYELPARVAPVVGIAVASVVGAVVLVALAYLGTRARFQPAWRYIAWGLTGVTLGLAVAFAPIVLDMPVTPDEFYRLMWLPSWI